MLLKPENLIIGINGKLWISTNRMKNGNSVKVPLLKKAVIIIERYKKDFNCEINGTLLPKVSNQKVNRYLRKLLQLVK